MIIRLSLLWLLITSFSFLQWEIIYPNDSERMIFQYRTSSKIKFISPQKGWMIDEKKEVFVTTDGGENWTSDLNEANFKIIDMFFLDDLVGFAVGTWGYCMKTIDGGKTWQNLYKSNYFQMHRMQLRYVHFKNNELGCII